jgi:hypothetical protein
MLLADIEDNGWYKVKALPLWLKGSEVKKPEVIASIRELVRRHEEEAEYNRKRFPSPDNIQVAQMSDKPPAFYISPDFEGVRQVVNDLNMPHSFDAGYFLRFFHGAEFIKYHKRSFLKFKKYSVEAFGVRIKLPADVDLFKLEWQPLPDPTNYKYPPSYWYESPYHLIQIWRLRVFKCPLERIQVPISNPLNPHVPPVVKFEWRWHPQNDPQYILYGPHNLFPRYPPKPIAFFNDCRRIIGLGRAIGRPSEFADPDFFIQIVTDAFRRLLKRNRSRPSRQLVAEKLEIDRKTLYHYLNFFKVPWPPC